MIKENAKISIPIKDCLDLPISKEIDLKEGINRIRKEKNTVILYHYYKTGDIQDISDFLGYSLQLGIIALKTLIPALPEDNLCSCSECFYMKRNTMEKLYLCFA